MENKKVIKLETFSTSIVVTRYTQKNLRGTENWSGLNYRLSMLQLSKEEMTFF